MGYSLPCFRQPSPPRLADKQEQSMKHDRSACSGMSSMKLGCLWGKETNKRRIENQQQLKEEKDQLTLEDWLIASPGSQKHSGGEYHVSKNSSKRIFPSFFGENANSNSSKPRVSVSKESLLKFEDHGERREDMEVGKSGRSKKRVSFRQPEEADIFLFHPSSSEESGEKDI